MKGCAIDDPVDEIRDGVAEALANALSLHVVQSDAERARRIPRT